MSNELRRKEDNYQREEVRRMPLRDHFHPPLSERRPWESFHSTWCTSLADYLNRALLPPGYIALEQIHRGAAVEIDVGTYAERLTGTSGDAGGIATLAKTIWLPSTSPLMFPAAFPDRFTVEIHSTEGGRTLVAAIELVSPGNKDRQTKRTLFAAKCAAYLAQGVGLVIVDTVSSRQGHLHNELVHLLGMDAALVMQPPAALYTVAYRPLSRDGEGWIDCWPTPLTIGETLPTVALSLSADSCLALDLEIAYSDACQRRRVNEVVE
jgi:hypothetical protein